jgi:acyl carrier protein
VKHLARRRQKIYKTGDLARWQPDGNVEFLGRLDYQVKIRGNRIELEEIKNRLLNHKKIKEAVVLVKDNEIGDRNLCAYIVPVSFGVSLGRDIEEISVLGLREFLSKHLPEYMIPSFFVHLEKLPLTPNGKIDRKLLQAYDVNVNSGVQYVAPETEIEKIITDIWQEVLKIDKVGVCDNFFDIGGHSLSIIKVNTKLRNVLNKEIPVAVMFRYPTISSLAGYFSSEETGKLPANTKERIDETVNTMNEAEVLFADEIN